MAEEQNKESNRGGLRSRLPKFLTEPISLSAGTPDTGASVAPDQDRKQAGGSGPTSAQDRKVKAPAEPASDNSPRPENLPSMNSASTATANRPESATAPAESAVDQESAVPLSSEEAQFQYFEYLVSEFQHMQSDMQRMYQLVEQVSERETAQEKVFNTLHAELRDYKNDFIYEHLKPVVRPLLFLFDSLEQFDAEIALYERPTNGERRQTGLSPSLVRENISFFRDQLIEALRICEVTPMESPKGAFNPRMHKVIDVVPVESKQDGMIQRVVRGGWFLNGQLLRSAEVIVGKTMS